VLYPGPCTDGRAGKGTTMGQSNRIETVALITFLDRLLIAGGFSVDEASAITRSLILSEQLGYSSHGIAQVSRYIAELKAGNVLSGAQLKVLRDTPNSLAADAQAGVGQIIMPILLKNMYSKISAQASVCIAVRNCGHIGRLGEWVEEPATAGYAALLMVNDNGSNFLVAPPGGKRAVTSTNPIAFSVPLPAGQIFAADMSTGAIAFGKVNLARRTRTAVPPNCIQDSNGRPTTSPEALFEIPAGSILPMGGAQGYKGFALSMFVDLLVAGLSGGQTPPAAHGTKGENCIMMALWNPKFFAGIEHMRSQAAKYIAFIRECPVTDDTKPIRIPGDRANAARQASSSLGVDLSEELVDELKRIGKQLGMEWSCG
jgi:uncharacterized oxidoreductase